MNLMQLSFCDDESTIDQSNAVFTRSKCDIELQLITRYEGGDHFELELVVQ